jgi:hypothetical protein
VSFRHPKSDRHERDRAWREWLRRHDAGLRAVAMPPAVTLSEAHWTDFLHNGYLEWHPEDNDGFTFDKLSVEQMRRLLTLLQASPEYSTAPMAGWIRMRMNQGVR